MWGFWSFAALPIYLKTIHRKRLSTVKDYSPINKFPCTQLGNIFSSLIVTVFDDTQISIPQKLLWNSAYK